MPEARHVDLRGTWFVLPTVFEEDGRFDAHGQQQVVAAAVSWGVDGFLTLGLMGEAPALTDEERTEVLRTVIQASAGRVPVAVGARRRRDGSWRIGSDRPPRWERGRS